MKPEVAEELLRQAEQWDELHRWERRELGKALRRLGLTYGEIRALIPVPKGTLSNWCHDVVLSAELVDAIRRRSHSAAGIPRDTQRRRREEVELLRAAARAEGRELVNDNLFVAGVVLYWGEGSKTRNDLMLSNSDPHALRLFVRWVRAYLDRDAVFRLGLHLHEGNHEAESQEYWRSALELPNADFNKTYVKPRGTGHRKNHLPHGVCRVRVLKASDHWHRTMAWIDHIRDHFA